MKKSVQVAATKTITKYLNDNKPENSSVYNISYHTTSVFNYGLAIGDSYFNDQDYLPISNTMRFLQVEYKPECYAMNRYLTTRELNKIFTVYKCKTLDDLIQAIYEEIEI